MTPVDGDAAMALIAAEREGYRLLLLGRTGVLGLALIWALYGAALSGNPIGPGLVALSLLVGVVELGSLGRPAERRWRRFALIGFDVACVAAAAVHAPLLAGQDVPQHFVFRAYGLHLLWFAPVVTALSLSPALVAFAGLAAAMAVWAIYLGVTMDMPRMLTWADLQPGADGATYVALLLDPDFVGRGNRIEESVALAAGGMLLALAVFRARKMVVSHARETAARRRIEGIFGRHVPLEIARQLAATGTLAPRIHDATVLHMDAEGFTRFADGRDPAEVMATLDALLARAAAVVAAHGGVPVSFAGDSLLAVFGAPSPLDNHAARATEAARAILAALDGAPLAVRIGVATGAVAAGVVGGEARQAFTIYGDVVNRAQRLEQACKGASERLRLSDETIARLADQ